MGNILPQYQADCVIMQIIPEKIDWQTGNWINQVLFFIAGCLFLSQNRGTGNTQETFWLYLAVNLILLGIALANIIVLKNNIRYFISLTVVLANTFLIPLSFYSYGKSLPFSVGASLFYVIITLAISPRLAGVGVLISAITFSCYLHYDKNIFEKYPVFKQEIAKLEDKIEKAGFPNLKQDENIKYYIVKKDENLKVISALPEVYDSPDYWNTIYVANKSQIKDPTQMIPVGTKLVIPEVKGVSYKIKYYTVQREARLEKISALKDVYGNPDDWKYLFEANKSKLKDPSLLVLAGTTLIVPEMPKVPYADFFKISLAYIAAAGIAFCWRILVAKMYQIYMMALSKSSGTVKKEVSDIKKKLEETRNEYRLLKEEAAMHILEMNKIVGHQKEEEKK
ncbi:MAG: hypothetical protein A2017_15830 [Lentisphaerae bacterium GWF2_44_16]|nr:MAG: hypothetical protein A2017_15830 [Lentisphaerae bacterium GWF2_44_16]